MPTKDIFRDQDEASREWRASQCEVDADIEGMDRDPELDAFVAELERAGFSDEECIERIKARVRAEQEPRLAGE